MTGADAGGMRNAVLRLLVAAAVVARLGVRLHRRAVLSAGTYAAADSGGAESRRVAGCATVSGDRGVQLRVAERAAGPVRLGSGTAVAAGRGVGRRLRPARRTPLPDRRARRAGRAVRLADHGPASAGATRLPAGDARPARHRGGGAGLPGVAAADGRVGPDGARARRGPLVRGGHRAGPAVLRHRGYGRRHRLAADSARRRPARRGRGLVRLLRRGAVRAGASARGEQARARLGGAELERGPAATGEHAAERRRAARRVRGPAVRLRSGQRRGRRGPPVPRRARAARHAGGTERRRSVLPRCPRRAPRGGGRASGRAHRADGPGARGGRRHGR